ncbi:MAG: hypothetical protein R2788_01275 [Saprospiraceae bacterium]
MNNTQPQDLFAAADQMMLAADVEMNRAAEDAVTHLICHNSRQSINNYLQGFLLKRGVAPAQPVTLAGLLEQCAAIDPRFRHIDISPIHCRFEANDGDYCLGLKAVEGCFKIARQTEKLVKE